MVVEFSEFKGNKILILKKTADDTYPMSMGVNKCKLVLENIENIKKFVKDNEKVK